MENKEVIHKLMGYFRKQSNQEDLLLSLASSMIDVNRMCHFSQYLCWIGTDADEGQKLEYEKFMRRLELNSKELESFILNGDNGKVFHCEQYEE